MTMFGKFIKAVIVLWTVAALNLSAQDFSSRWLFGSDEINFTGNQIFLIFNRFF